MSPFDAPEAELDVVESYRSDELQRRARRAWILLAIPLAGIPLAILASFLSDVMVWMVFLLTTGAMAILGAAVFAIGLTTTVAILRQTVERKGLVHAIAVIPVGLAFGWMGVASFASLFGGGFRGRQLRARGRVVHAELVEGSAWIAREAAAARHPDVSREIADAWRKNGLTEHASIAAFAQLATELVALGAPPRLIEDAHRDALDEMKHTRLCFELAFLLDGRRIGPGMLAAARSAESSGGSRAGRLVRLAIHSLADGVLNEGWSARLVASLAKEDVDARVLPVLEAVARDEARHAAHAFDVVRWCAAEGGAPVAAALRGALGAIPARMIDRAHAFEAEHWGVPSRAREDRAYEEARAKVISRTQRLLGDELV